MRGVREVVFHLFLFPKLYDLFVWAGGCIPYWHFCVQLLGTCVNFLDTYMGVDRYGNYCISKI